MKEQARFWFVTAHGYDDRGVDVVNLAVSAFTERQARMHARKRLGPHFTITEVSPVVFAHAWVMDHGWSPKQRLGESQAVAASDPHAGSTGKLATRDKSSSSKVRPQDDQP